jgi:hypothetical protein
MVMPEQKNEKPCISAGLLYIQLPLYRRQIVPTASYLWKNGPTKLAGTIPAEHQHLNVSLQVVGEIAPHLLALSPVTGLLLSAVRAVPKTAAPLKVLATHAADVRNDFLHRIQYNEKIGEKFNIVLTR